MTGPQVVGPSLVLPVEDAGMVSLAFDSFKRELRRNGVEVPRRVTELDQLMRSVASVQVDRSFPPPFPGGRAPEQVIPSPHSQQGGNDCTMGTAQVASSLSLTTRRVRQLAKEGKLSARWVAGRWEFDEKEVEAWSVQRQDRRSNTRW